MQTTTDNTPLAAPMLDFVGIAAVCGTTRKHAESLVYGGRISPSFNLTCGCRRFMRVYRPSVENFVAGRCIGLTVDDVTAAVFPDKVEAVPAVRVYEWLNVGPDHFYRLVEIGLIECSAWSRGPYNSARVNVVSLAAFLKRRCLSPA